MFCVSCPICELTYLVLFVLLVSLFVYSFWRVYVVPLQLLHKQPLVIAQAYHFHSCYASGVASVLAPLPLLQFKVIKSGVPGSH